MKNILVTGGAGYIGSHTVKELIHQWFHPIIFDNLENGKVINQSGSEFYQWDLRNIEDIEGTFIKYSIDAVIHFAAYASVPDSVDFPDKYYVNNLHWWLNLLNAMNKYKVKKIIFSSSASVYGEPQSERIREDHPKNPTNPYGHTKLLFEQILHWYHIAYGISSISFRYFCASGASKDGSLGELHTPETHVIPCAILTALGIRKEFNIYGDNFPTPDGTGIRDFIHVEDLASAHVMGLQKLDDNICEQFNLGIGKGFSVKEIIESVQRISGNQLNTVLSPRRKGDPSILIAENQKIMSFMDWKPQYINIDDIVSTAFQFFKKYYEN